MLQEDVFGLKSDNCLILGIIFMINFTYTFRAGTGLWAKFGIYFKCVF